MFRKLTPLALFAPLVAGLTLNIPQNPTSAGLVTITWTFVATDPPFSLELLNTDFHDSFAIANNILPTSGSLTLTLPSIPVGGGYTLAAVNVGNVNDAYSTTGGFSVGANSASVSSSASTSATGTGTASGTAKGASSTGASSTGVLVTSHTPVSTTGFGTTQTGPPTFSTASTAGLTTKSSTTTAPATTGGAFNGAATFKMNSQVGAIAAAFFSAVAGAAIFAL